MVNNGVWRLGWGRTRMGHHSNEIQTPALYIIHPICTPGTTEVQRRPEWKP